MPSPSITARSSRFAALCGAAIAVASLVGCQGGILPSARLAPTMFVEPTPPGAANPVAPMPTPDAACLAPPVGYCGADACPSVKTWRGARLLRCLGPLFYREDEEDLLTEAELYPPHSRFHPVPTAPVFAQRTEYEPPQLMMAPVPAEPHLAPRALPDVPRGRLLSPLPANGDSPAMQPWSTAPPAAQKAPEPVPPGPPHEEGYDPKASREPQAAAGN
ncbi:MAG: hypothetical protein ACYC3X_31930 [Pirellulaceae bacterium]